MSRLRQSDEIIAIFCADLHLTLEPPVWRSAEPDWLKAQERVLDEINDLAEDYECPIFAAGDIFDKPIVSTELCNWAIEALPQMYAIPGQHDLPDHRYEDIHKTGFRNLVNANVIEEIEYNVNPTSNSKIMIYGFPFDKKIEICQTTWYEHLTIALVHDYVWIPNHSFPNAPEEAKLTGKKEDYIDEKWFGYDVVVFGDNHKGFSVGMGKTTVFNCGTLMRRKSDEINYKPRLGLLTKKGKIIPYYLDTSQDKYIEPSEAKKKEEIEEENPNMSKFFKELEKLGKSALDFVQSMKNFLRQGGTEDEVKAVILKHFEKVKND